jgi:hypothetical protein
VSGKVDAIAYPQSALGGTPGTYTQKKNKNRIIVKGPSMSIFTTPGKSQTMFVSVHRFRVQRSGLRTKKH